MELCGCGISAFTLLSGCRPGTTTGSTLIGSAILCDVNCELCVPCHMVQCAQCDTDHISRTVSCPQRVGFCVYHVTYIVSCVPYDTTCVIWTRFHVLCLVHSVPVSVYAVSCMPCDTNQVTHNVPCPQRAGFCVYHVTYAI